MIQKAPANIASILEIEKDEPMYFIERIRYANDEIFQFETTYMSALPRYFHTSTSGIKIPFL